MILIYYYIDNDNYQIVVWMWGQSDVKNIYIYINQSITLFSYVYFYYDR